jgi:hypothetical protein
MSEPSEWDYLSDEMQQRIIDGEAEIKRLRAELQQAQKTILSALEGIEKLTPENMGHKNDCVCLGCQIKSRLRAGFKHAIAAAHQEANE